jgi:hypothetical protein
VRGADRAVERLVEPGLIPRARRLSEHQLVDDTGKRGDVGAACLPAIGGAPRGISGIGRRRHAGSLQRLGDADSRYSHRVAAYQDVPGVQRIVMNVHHGSEIKGRRKVRRHLENLRSRPSP